jgi:glycosyltransferase involved in cell wall biosynthesis
MQFLINASNLKNGGGLQVAKSICEQLHQYVNHHFIVVLSTYINDEHISASKNVEVFKYNIPQNVKSVLFGRDAFLDGLVVDKRVDAVLTVFGPSLWRPRVPHLCGFARAQLLKEVNPNVRPTIKEWFVYKIWTWGFRKSSTVFYTENPYISEMLPRLIKGTKVYTVSNYYNQVFDYPEQWRREIELPSFNGTTMLTISITGRYKNLGIMVPIAEYLEKELPEFNFRFVLTIKDAPFQLPEKLRNHFVFIGKVDVSECPNLYEQADVMFMPTLMECFTATYPEAMRMEVPIVTTDLEFAHGLCGAAACYYSALDAKAAAEAIYKVATDKEYAQKLVTAGKEQLGMYDNYKQRAEKLINILEEISK